MRVTHTPRWTLVPLVLFILLALAGRAEAGPLVASAMDCRQDALERPFVPWADPAQYFLAPDGAFNGGGEGWTRSGADIVAEDRPGTDHAGDAPASLRLTSGESAVSPVVCVGLEHPTLRFFARNTGSLLGAIRVEVLFEDAAGTVRSLPIGVVADLSGWSPTLPMPVVANLLALVPGERTPVAFRFKAIGLGSSWQIDDVYVDPWSK